jgi:Fe-S-cluster-containing dehydrogenase component
VKIACDVKLCYACGTCQLACSFHHTGTFWPDQSSIEVSRNPQTGAIKWHIAPSCDGCPSEGKPLCVQYCVYGALRTQDTGLLKGTGESSL